MKAILFFLLLLPMVGLSQWPDSLWVIGFNKYINSKELHEIRNFHIRLPTGYKDNLSHHQHYPVLYLLDGESNFSAVCGLVERLSMSYLVPDMIVVGIDNTDRTRDLTPTTLSNSSSSQKTGGNEQFFKFLTKELIPYIDSTYNTLPYRILIGHSLGGITAINALFTIPNVFNAYIVIDPSLWWDNKALMGTAKNYFLRSGLTNRSLFLGQANTLGGVDTLTNVHFEAIKEFALLLQTRNCSGINWKYNYYEDDDHGSVALIAQYEGLRFIFKDYHIKTADILMNPQMLKDQFDKLSAETGVAFAPPAQVLNKLSDPYYRPRMLEVCAQYCQLAIHYYPQRPFGYSHMGDICLKEDDTKQAIEYFKKALEADTEYEYARDKIKELSSK